VKRLDATIRWRRFLSYFNDLVDVYAPRASPRVRRPKLIGIFEQKLDDALRPTDEETRNCIRTAWDTVINGTYKRDDFNLPPNPARLISRAMDDIEQSCSAGLRRRIGVVEGTMFACLEKHSREIDEPLVERGRRSWSGSDSCQIVYITAMQNRRSMFSRGTTYP
jgi:hypothetical protein